MSIITLRLLMLSLFLLNIREMVIEIIDSISSLNKLWINLQNSTLRKTKKYKDCTDYNLFGKDVINTETLNRI